MNDYPADIPAAALHDHDRVYPGDGAAPIGAIADLLRAIGSTPFLSLELFNRDYWQQDALTVAKTGLAKMRAAVGE